MSTQATPWGVREAPGTFHVVDADGVMVIETNSEDVAMHVVRCVNLCHFVNTSELGAWEELMCAAQDACATLIAIHMNSGAGPGLTDRQHRIADRLYDSLNALEVVTEKAGD